MAAVSFLSVMYSQVLPGEVFVGLIAGLIAGAFLIGVRLGTWWWTFGPVVAYGVLATLYLNSVYAQYQAMERPRLEGTAWDEVAVLVGAMFVMAPCALGAVAGVAVAAIVRSRAASRPGVTRPGILRQWLLPPPGSATARDVLVAHSITMTASPSPSSLEPGTVGLPGQPRQPAGDPAVAGRMPNTGVRGE
jgi:hypothetical protein